MDCSICVDSISSNDHSTKFKCGHQFHTSCISHWLLLNNTCPHCRTEVYHINTIQVIEESLDISIINDTIFELYNESLIDTLYDTIEDVIDDINDESFSGWLKFAGGLTMHTILYNKKGYIWTQFIYNPEQNHVLVFFNEYKVYQSIDVKAAIYPTHIDQDIILTPDTTIFI